MELFRNAMILDAPNATKFERGLIMGDFSQLSHIFVLVGFGLVFYVFWQVFNKAGRALAQRIVMALVCSILVSVTLGLIYYIAIRGH